MSVCHCYCQEGGGGVPGTRGTTTSATELSDNVCHGLGGGGGKEAEDACITILIIIMCMPVFLYAYKYVRMLACILSICMHVL